MSSHKSLDPEPVQPYFRWSEAEICSTCAFQILGKGCERPGGFIKDWVRPVSNQKIAESECKTILNMGDNLNGAVYEYEEGGDSLNGEFWRAYSAHRNNHV
jgi:hypothetical protein